MVDIFVGIYAHVYIQWNEKYGASAFILVYFHASFIYVVGKLFALFSDERNKGY